MAIVWGPKRGGLPQFGRGAPPSAVPLLTAGHRSSIARLTANQVASVVDWIEHNGNQGRGNPVYALAVLFAAHTGVRTSESQGLQLQDVTLSALPATVGAIRIVRTAQRRERVWIYGTPKSDASTDRVVPLAPWLADKLRQYLTTVHPFSASNAAGNKYIPYAPLFPGRRNRYVFDWAKPVCAASLYKHYFQRSGQAVTLGHGHFHDLRHRFVTMNLSAGEHYMQLCPSGSATPHSC